MFDKVEIIRPDGAVLSLPLYIETEGYLIEDITGLDPVKTNMVSTSFAGMDGETYQAGRREKRNILITLKLLPNFQNKSVREMRNELYSFLMPKPKAVVKLQFTLENGDEFEISTRVESFEAPIFVKEPKATISLIAFDPDFLSSDVTTIGASTTSTSTTTNINYTGSVDSGIIFELLADRAMGGFTLYNEPPSGILQTMEFVDTITSGDFIRFVTIPGSKEALRTSGSTIKSVLNGVSPYAKWISLEPGLNKFRVFAEGVAVPYEVKYNVRVGGL